MERFLTYLGVWLTKLMPFLLMGMAIVAVLMGLYLLSYLLVFGAGVGLMLYVVSWFREKLYMPVEKTAHAKPKPSGRIIEHDSSD